MPNFIGRHSRRFVVAAVLAAISIVSAPAWAAVYEYDALGRIVKVTYDDGSYVVYTYDAAGNRVVVTATKS